VSAVLNPTYIQQFSTKSFSITPQPRTAPCTNTITATSTSVPKNANFTHTSVSYRKRHFSSVRSVQPSSAARHVFVQRTKSAESEKCVNNQSINQHTLLSRHKSDDSEKNATSSNDSTQSINKHALFIRQKHHTVLGRHYSPVRNNCLSDDPPQKLEYNSSKTLDSQTSQKPSSAKRETSVKDRRDGPIEMPDIDKPGDHKKRAIFRFKSLEETK
jgi:hypothetical protein